MQAEPEAFLQAGARLDALAIEALIAQRTLAKSQRDYAQADLIRQQLLAQGITLKDGAAGTTWQAAAA